MRRGEDLLLSTRSIKRRLPESILLIIGIALGIGAAGAGIAMMASASAESRKLLSSPEYREIVVSIRQDTEDMELPAVPVYPDTEVILTSADLKAAEEVPDVQYAYVASRTRFRLGEGGFPFPEPRAPDNRAAAGRATTGGRSAPAEAGEAQERAPVLPEELEGYEVSPEFFSAWNLQAAQGSLFTREDMARGEPLLILGSQAAADRLSQGSDVGDRLLIGGQLYTITGILERTGTEYDRMAFSPVFMPDLQNQNVQGLRLRRWGTDLRFAVTDADRLEQARQQLSVYFDRNYGEGSVIITIPRAEAQAARDRAGRLVTVVLFLSIAGLLIAAVNVSNILYSRAIRRHRAVGILKALGASMGDVFRLFFSEALLLGAFGAALGVGISLLISRLMKDTVGFSRIPVGMLALGISGAWLITMALTVYPALQAARVPAAEAIRSE